MTRRRDPGGRRTTHHRARERGRRPPPATGRWMSSRVRARLLKANSPRPPRAQWSTRSSPPTGLPVEPRRLFPHRASSPRREAHRERRTVGTTTRSRSRWPAAADEVSRPTTRPSTTNVKGDQQTAGSRGPTRGSGHLPARLQRRAIHHEEQDTDPHPRTSRPQRSAHPHPSLKSRSKSRPPAPVIRAGDCCGHWPGRPTPHRSTVGPTGVHGIDCPPDIATGSLIHHARTVETDLVATGRSGRPVRRSRSNAGGDARTRICARGSRPGS